MPRDVIELKDGISGPAKAAAGELRGLDKVLQAVKKTSSSSFGTKAFDSLRASSSAATAEIRKIQDEYKKLQHAASKPIKLKVDAPAAGSGIGGLDKLLGAFKGEGGGLSGLGAAGVVGAILSVVGMIKDAVSMAIQSAIGLVHAGAMYGIAASDFRSETVGAFQKMVGGAQLANGLYDKVLDVAAKTGVSSDTLLNDTRRLLAAGFKANEVPRLLTAFADLEKVKGEGSSKGIEKLLQKVKASDKFDAKAVSALAKQGVSTAAVYDTLAKKLGKTRSEAEAMVKAGKVNAAMGVDVVTSALEKRFGGAAGADSVQDMLAAIKIRVSQLFDGIDTGPLKGALGNLEKALTGSSGGKLKSSIQGFFGQLFKTLFDPFTGAGGQQRLEAFVSGVAQGLDKLTALMKAAAPGVKLVADLIANLGKKDEKGVSGLDKMLATFSRILEIVKLLSGMSKNPLESIAKIFAPTEAGKAPKGKGVDVGVPVAAANAIGTLDTTGIQNEQAGPFGAVGDAMVDGVVGAVQAGTSRVTEACRAMGQAGAAGAMAGIDAHSPSRVFAGIGLMAVQGFAGGVTANDRLAAAATSSMAQGSAAAAMAAPGGAGGGAAGGGSHTFNINVPMAVHASDAAGGKEAGDAAAGPLQNAIRDGITRALREQRAAA